MKSIVFVSTLLALTIAPCFADGRGPRFVTITCHDIVDKRESLDAYGLTTAKFVELLEFIRGNGWTAISLDDVEQATRTGRPLPERAVLLTFDDAYQSAYTRVFPLLLAYKMPALVAVVGSWMEHGNGSQAQFLSWDEAREMQHSGLVEFASHTYDMHHGLIGNPQGNEFPAAAYRKYVSNMGYETEEQYRARIREDLDESRAQMQRELGKAPRAVVWPYGRYTQEAADIARESGFTFAFNLDPEPDDAYNSMALSRYILAQDFDIDRISNDLKFLNVLPSAQRVVRLDPSALWSTDVRQTDARLGQAIERVRKLGATSIVIDAAVAAPNGTLSATWFPNSYLPMQGDLFSRIAWQMHTRGGVSVFGRLPVSAALNTMKDKDAVAGLFRDFGAAAPIDGLLLEETPQLAALQTKYVLGVAAPWEVRRRRNAVNANGLSSIDALGLRCYRILEAARPRLMLALLTTEQTLPGPSSIADMTLVTTSEKPKEAARLLNHFKKLSFQEELFPRRFGIWINGPEPPSSSNLIAITRMFQRNGISVIGWDDDMIHDNPPAALVAGTVSASTFPVRF